MYSFEFQTIDSFEETTRFEKGFYLWIWHANKIPPHIGCSINGKYFSLKVKGKDNGIDSFKAFQLIQKKSIPALFIELNQSIIPSYLQEVYDRYQHAEPNIATCLTPISQLFNCLSEVRQLSELLKYLQDRNKIEKVFGVNLDNDYRGILNYNQEDITNRLQKLKDVKREKHISKTS